MLKITGIFALVACLMGSLAQASDKYVFDKTHTHVAFTINHLGFSNVLGRIKEYEGYFTFDEREPQKSEVEVVLKPVSVDTDVPLLNSELQKEKFFNTAKFPEIRFRSTRVVVTGKNTGDVTGDMTMLGVTRPVVMHVTYNRSGIHPFSNNYISGFSAHASLRRSDFGMKAYIPDVGDEVHIQIEVEGVNPLRHPGNAKTPH